MIMPYSPMHAQQEALFGFQETGGIHENCGSHRAQHKNVGLLCQMDRTLAYLPVTMLMLTQVLKTARVHTA